MPGPGEALWTDDDRAWAIALLVVEDEVCRGCGQPVTESTDPELEELWAAEVVRCHACAAAGRHMEAWQRSPGVDPHGAHARIIRKEALPWQTVPSVSG